MLLPSRGIVSLSLLLEFRLGHMSCFGQGDISKHHQQRLEKYLLIETCLSNYSLTIEYRPIW